MRDRNPDAARAAGMCPTCGNVICICSKEIEPLPPLHERVEAEKAERAERIERLTNMTDRLFPGEEQAVLRAAIQETFNVPQWGKYHNEGVYMDTHLDKIMDTIEDLYAGKFPKAVTEEMKVIIQRATAGDKEKLQRYALLHDLEKKSTIKLKRTDGSEEDISWDAWKAMLPGDLAEHPDPVALEAFLRESDIEAISYYHEEQKHGDAGADTIEGMEGVGVDSLIVAAIRNHEVAFQFQGTQPATYEEYFGELSEEEVAWVITASYMDQLASYQSDDPRHTESVPNLDALVFLLDSKHNYETLQALKVSLDADSDMQAWKAGGLKDVRIEKEVNRFAGQKDRLRPVEDLLSELKDTFAPKLILGPMVGRLVGVLKSMGLGTEFNTVRMALIGMKEGVDLEAVKVALSEVPIEEAQRASIATWVEENILS